MSRSIKHTWRLGQGFSPLKPLSFGTCSIFLVHGVSLVKTQISMLSGTKRRNDIDVFGDINEISSRQFSGAAQASWKPWVSARGKLLAGSLTVSDE